MKSNGCEPLLNILQKNYKATICINKLITSFSPFDIKCIKLNLMQKTSGNVFLRHLRGRVFHIFPRLHSVMGVYAFHFVEIFNFMECSLHFAYILERVRFFYLRFTALIRVSIETF